MKAWGALALLAAAGAYAQDAKLPAGAVDAWRVESQYGADQAVLNPRFPQDGKLELGVGGQFSSSSSLMKYAGYQASAVFHINGRHAIEPVWYSKRSWSNVGNFVKNLQDDAEAQNATDKLVVSVPEQIIAASYFFSPFYSKMHLTEQSVVHFDVYMGAGFGMMKLRDLTLTGLTDTTESHGAAVLTAGVRFLMGSRWGLRLEMRDLIHSAKNFGKVSKANTLQIGASADIFFGSFKGAGRD